MTSSSTVMGSSGDKKLADFDFAPFRPFDDFLLDGARFSVPPYRDLPKWNNRMLANLLYYQTNYFAMLFVCFFLVGLVHPKDVLLGFLSLVLVLASIYFGTSNSPELLQFKREHPVLSVVGILVVAYLVVYLLGSVIVFLYGILLPVFLVLIHASVRLRSLRNKVTQKMEAAGFTRTAMGKLLDAAGVEVSLVTF